MADHFRTSDFDRRRDAHGERLARVETGLALLREETAEQSKILGKTADDMTEVKIILAEDRGHRRAIGYMAHAASVVIGAIAGFFGGGYGR
jgi:hypothetical protein